MRVHHLAFRTRDLTRLERFYADALGLTVARRDGERSVWLRAGGTLLMLEVAEEGEPEVRGDTKDLVAFEIEAPDVERWRRVLEANGIPIEGQTGFTLYFRDPDGRRIGLSHY
jgi:catechol 2,3-dioxygenase-like lactoylglutathione lyase family enzyme